MSSSLPSRAGRGSGWAIAHPLPEDLVELIAQRFRALSIDDEGFFDLCEHVCGSLRHRFEALHEIVASGGR